MSSRIHFSFFATKESTKPQVRSLTWDEFVADVLKGQEVITPELKDFRYAFNAIEYKDGGRRQTDDAIAVHALVLDYDEAVTFEQTCAVLNAFKGCELVAYTSFNHQRKKHEGDYERDKFRVIIPLTEPIPANVWPELTTYLFTEFAPAADKQGESLAQHYSWKYVPEQTKHLAQVKHLQGKPLDWTSWPRIKVERKRNADGSYKKAKADHFLEPDFQFRTAKGTITFSEVTGYTPKVFCPHHNDRSPGSFLNKKGSTIWHHCKKCGTTKIRQSDDYDGDDNDDAIKKFIAAKPVATTERKSSSTAQLSQGAREHLNKLIAQASRSEVNPSTVEELLKYLFANVDADVTELDDVIRSLRGVPEKLAKKINNKLIKRTKERASRRQKEKFDELFGTDEHQIPFDLEKRKALLKKHCLDERDNLLLFTAEGFGKSHMAVLWASKEKKLSKKGKVLHKKSRKVLFACGSNKQAAEQAESFRKHGLKVQEILGRQYLLARDYGIKAEMGDKRHPWDTERINENATIKRIMAEKKVSKERATEIWKLTGPDQPNWDDHDIVVTTTARTQAFGQINARASHYIKKYVAIESAADRAAYVSDAVPEDMRDIFDAFNEAPDAVSLTLKFRDRIAPKGCVVFFDDTPRNYFKIKEPIRPYHSIKATTQADRIKGIRESHSLTDDVTDQSIIQKYELKSDTTYALTSDGQSMEVNIATVNGRKYYRRPNEYVLGYGLEHCQLVFTTTEIIACELIQRMYPTIVKPALMPYRLDVGNITMIKTKIVQSKTDGFLPVIMNRIRRTFPFEYFANGQGTEHNLESTKGNNSFAQTDIVVECSIPHFNEVTHYLDELDIPESERRVIEVALAMDNLQQALGRNSGYRWWDLPQELRKSAVVLCDPRLFDSVIQFMRYRVRTSVDDASERVNLVDARTSLVDDVCYYITYLDQYLNGIGKRGQAFRDDASDVMTSIGEKNRRVFRKRLCVALDNWLKRARDAAAPNKNLIEKVHRWWVEWGGEMYSEKEAAAESQMT